MALNNHEKWIRDNIDGMKVNVDSNELWASLESHVPKKKRRGVFFWIFPGVAAVIIALGGLWLYSNEPTAIADVTANQSVAQVMTPSVEPTAEATNTVMQTQQENIESTSQYNASEDVINKIENEVNFSIPQKAITTSTVNNSIDVNQLEASKLKAKVANNNNNNNNNNSVEIIAEVNDINTARSVESIAITEEVTEIDQSTNTEEAIENELREMYAFKNLDQSTKLDFFPNELDYETPQPNEVKMSKTPRLFASLSSGVSMYTGNTESSNMEFDYNLYQKEYTNALPSYYYSLGLAYDISPRWTATATIRQQSLVDRTSISYTEKLTGEIDGVTENVIDLQGNIQQTNGSLNTYTTSEIEGQWHQYTEAFDLQMGARYKFLNLGRWNSQIGAGITYNLSSNVSGTYLSENGTRERLTSSNQAANQRLRPYANFQINYKINKRLSIGLEGQYQQLNNKLNTLNTKLISEYHIGNIGLICQYGIR